MMTRVNALIDARRTIAAGLTPVLLQLKDASIPLDERWEAFIALIKGNVIDNIELYGDGKIDTLGSNLTLYDDFNVERYETMTYDDMYERILEDEDKFQNVDAWREAVLTSGHSGFKHDW